MTIRHLRAAVAGKTRFAGLPDVPTVSDVVPGFEASAWQGVGVPRGTQNVETHKTSPDFDQTAADKAKNRIKQALGEIGCDVFIETDR